MRWIKHNKNKIERGEVAAPDGDLFFVDETGSRALVGGVLYIDGKPAPVGAHIISLKDEDISIDADKDGKVKAKKRTKKGGGKVAK